MFQVCRLRPGYSLFRMPARLGAVLGPMCGVCPFQTVRWTYKQHWYILRLKAQGLRLKAQQVRFLLGRTGFMPVVANLSQPLQRNSSRPAESLTTHLTAYNFVVFQHTVCVSRYV